MKKLSIILIILSLSACHHHASHNIAHHGYHNARVAKLAVNRSIALLESEHKHVNVVVVNKPRKKARCWKHVRHWHCST